MQFQWLLLFFYILIIRKILVWIIFVLFLDRETHFAFIETLQLSKSLGKLNVRGGKASTKKLTLISCSCAAAPVSDSFWKIGSCEMLVDAVATLFVFACEMWCGAEIDSTSVRVSDILSMVVEWMTVFPDDGFDDDYIFGWEIWLLAKMNFPMQINLSSGTHLFG